MPPGAGVELREERSEPLTTPRFLSLSTWRHEPSRQVFELVERPGRTLDVLPWFRLDGQVFVLAKKGFPRPIVNACADHPNLAGAALSGYVTEPLAAITLGGEAAPQAIARILRERAGLREGHVLHVSEPVRYFTSPGGVNERVSAYLVEVLPSEVPPALDYGPFTSAGSVRELDARRCCAPATWAAWWMRGWRSTSTGSCAGWALPRGRGSAPRSRSPSSPTGPGRRRTRSPPSAAPSSPRTMMGPRATCLHARAPSPSGTPRGACSRACLASTSCQRGRAATRRWRCRWCARARASGWAWSTASCRRCSTSRAARGSRWRRPGGCRARSPICPRCPPSRPSACARSSP
ncbi:hypothetical protein ACN28S_63210 [Cystobacter fuscus]